MKKFMITLVLAMVAACGGSDGYVETAQSVGNLSVQCGAKLPVPVVLDSGWYQAGNTEYPFTGYSSSPIYVVSPSLILPLPGNFAGAGQVVTVSYDGRIPAEVGVQFCGDNSLKARGQYDDQRDYCEFYTFRNTPAYLSLTKNLYRAIMKVTKTNGSSSETTISVTATGTFKTCFWSL